MPQNLVEKIVQLFAVDLVPGQEVAAGDFVTVRPAHVMTHDNTSAVMQRFVAIGAAHVADPRQPVFTLDHNVQDHSDKNLAKYRAIEAFAAAEGIDFHPAGRGIGHQVMAEEGYAWPGTLVVASDSHSNLYGGLGALGTPVVRTDAAAIWSTGRTWWQVPAVAKVELQGRLPRGVSGKDVIVALCGHFNQDEVLNHAIEFAGDGVAALSVDQRLTIANMTTEWGALAGVFPCDGATTAWLRVRREAQIGRGDATPRIDLERLAGLERAPLVADPGAVYAKHLVFELGAVTPHVSGPDTVKNITSVAAIEPRRVAIQKAYLLSCVNGRVEDLAEAAAVLDGRKIAAGVEMYVAAASSEVEAESRSRGDWQKLEAAGARTLPPGCGPCIGLGIGLLQDGEIGISATNRNFKGRMGSRDAQAYLASPAVVAASAAAGYICAPERCTDRPLVGRVETPGAPAKARGKTTILPGFPTVLQGELLFCDADNLNTDGIYPGTYTYREDLTPEQMAAVAMENYDPGFQALARAGDLLVGGFNFGTGSSREQAATALQYRGFPLVIAGSYSDTYKRNAFNNGLPLIDCAALVAWLRARFPERVASRRTGVQAVADFEASVLRLTSAGAGTAEFAFPPLGRAAQELVIAGGLEALTARRLEVRA
ncbi:MAG TPA: homoaconitase [Planctomycetota bacterium]